MPTLQMTRVIVLTQEAFEGLAQTPGRIRYMNEDLSDAGYRNICLDSFGDWCTIIESPEFKSGTIHTIDSIVNKVKVA